MQPHILLGVDVGISKVIRSIAYTEYGTMASWSAQQKLLVPNSDWILGTALNFVVCILEVIHKKRNLRRTWQKHRSPRLRAELLEATKGIRKSLQDKNQQSMQNYRGLPWRADTDYSLWKACGNLKGAKKTFTALTRALSQCYQASD